jgi:hypothetical protein
MIARRALDPGHHPGGRLRIEVRRGFVEEQVAGLGSERGSERHALHLTSGEGACRALRQRGEAECCEH